MNASSLIADRLLLAKLAGAAMWLAWVVSLVLGDGVRDNQGQVIGVDHLAFYSAARAIEEGEGRRIYDYGEFMVQYQSGIVGSPIFDAFRNPPFYALLYVPTAGLPYVASFWIWSVVSVALLWLGLRWLGFSSTARIFVWALTFYPVFAAISFGQNSLLSFAAFALCYCLLEGKRPLLAGMAAGLLLYKPQLLICLGLWWLLEWRTYWRALAGLTATGVVLLAVSFLAIPVESRAFIDHLPEIAKYDAFDFWNLHTPRGFWTLLFGDDKRMGIVLGSVCSLIALVGFALFWRRHRGDRPLLFGAAVFVTLWASPHTMIYDWTLVLIPAALVWERRPAQRSRWLLLFAVGWLALFVGTVAAKWQMQNLGWAVQVSVPTMAVLGVIAALALKRENAH